MHHSPWAAFEIVLTCVSVLALLAYLAAAFAQRSSPRGWSYWRTLSFRPDPAPHRPGKSFRLLVLFLSIGAHAFLSKAMYAYDWPTGTHHSLEEIRAGAKIMYYGGDFAELLLVISLFTGGLLGLQKAPAHIRSLALLLPTSLAAGLEEKHRHSR